MKNYEGILLALTRPCPRCGSASGMPCMSNTKTNRTPGWPPLITYTDKSKPTTPHTARMKEN